jgi:hypothetical protein
MNKALHQQIENIINNVAIEDPLVPHYTLTNNVLYNPDDTSFGIIDENRRIININRPLGAVREGVNDFLNQNLLVTDSIYKVTDGDNYHEFNVDENGRVIHSYHWIQKINLHVTNCSSNSKKAKILPIEIGGICESINEVDASNNFTESDEFRGMIHHISKQVFNQKPAQVHVTFAFKNASAKACIYVVEDSFGKQVYEFEL